MAARPPAFRCLMKCCRNRNAVSPVLIGKFCCTSGRSLPPKGGLARTTWNRCFSWMSVMLSASVLVSVWIDERAAEDYRHDNLIDLRAVLRRELEELNDATRGGRQAGWDFDVIVAPDARPTGSDGHCTKLRAIGIAHA